MTPSEKKASRANLMLIKVLLDRDASDERLALELDAAERRGFDRAKCNSEPQNQVKEVRMKRWCKKRKKWICGMWREL